MGKSEHWYRALSVQTRSNILDLAPWKLCIVVWGQRSDIPSFWLHTKPQTLLLLVTEVFLHVHLPVDPFFITKYIVCDREYLIYKNIYLCCYLELDQVEWKLKSIKSAIYTFGKDLIGNLRVDRQFIASEHTSNVWHLCDHWGIASERKFKTPYVHFSNCTNVVHLMYVPLRSLAITCRNPP